ncbi:MAG TPA: hypothetical protein VIW67_01040 [Terriglobales bacterium]|jgi:hypothetical protein
MSALLEIIEKIRDTETAISMAERSLRSDPSSETAEIMAKSFLKRQAELKEELSQCAKQNVLDICSYRLFSENEAAIKITSLANVLFDFQSLFTTVVDAIKNGPKLRAKPEATLVSMTSFDFGYCFNGSAGIVMTMPDELILIGETDFDRAIQALFAMAKSNTSEELATFAKTLGVASVRKMHRWTIDHLHDRTGADIKWVKDKEVKHQLFIQPQELETLQRVIEETSEEVEEIATLTGKLVGLDVDLKRFHMTFEGANDIKGEISPAIGTSKTLEVPKLYTVEVLVKKKIKFSTETEEVSHFLLKVF